MDKSRRVVITHPRTSTRRRPSRTSAPRDLREHTVRGEVLLTALRRSQFRLAMGIAAVFLTTIAAIPILYWSTDWFPRTQIRHLPLIWLTLGIGIFPVIIGLGWVHVRMAEWYEQRFVELVEDV